MNALGTNRQLPPGLPASDEGESVDIVAPLLAAMVGRGKGSASPAPLPQVINGQLVAVCGRSVSAARTHHTLDTSLSSVDSIDYHRI